MNGELKRFLPELDRPCRVAIFLSGVGSNAEVLLRRQQENPSEYFKFTVLVTDAPGRSRAGALAEEFGLPLQALDIREFYRERGLPSISLATAAGRECREEWTVALRRLIAPYRIDFGVLAGFVPLTNLTGDFPCLNVHPGDLTLLDEGGNRLLAGLHAKPVETALCLGLSALRSSVIVAQPYTGRGGEMDTGPVLGVSAPVPAETDGFAPDELETIRRRRLPGVRAEDELSQLAARNLEKLKFRGDHLVLPQVVEAFAAGRYREDETGLFFRGDGGFQPVKTVEYGERTVTPLPR